MDRGLRKAKEEVGPTQELCPCECTHRPATCLCSGHGWAWTLNLPNQSHFDRTAAPMTARPSALSIRTSSSGEALGGG